MKLVHLFQGLTGTLVYLISVFPPGAAAQTGSGNPLIPVVTIQATQPIATGTNPGVFTFYRSGNPTNDLNVYCRFGGTASNGVDYVEVGSLVLIPSGVYSSTILITPINPGQTSAAQTVIAELVPSPLMNPVNYDIGSPNNAVVYIEGAGVTNIPPEVSLVNPTNGSVFCPPADISLVAYARDLDGSVSSVEFFAGTTSLGIVSNGVIIDPLPSGVPPPGTRAYLLMWSNAPAGQFLLTAKATDNNGASTVSAPVAITVNPGPTPTNKPPIVRLSSPSDGTVFHAPVDIPLFAYAVDYDGYVESVQFFDNGGSLGYGQPLPVASPDGGASTSPIAGNLYSLVWSNASGGIHALTALATDNDGASTTSAPVNIAVSPTPPLPTNPPPIVNIVAADPIAIEGTNCWPWLGLVSATPTWSNWVSPTAICRFFTNCGPKNAVFAFRRFGDTNNELTLSYSVGGTAANGVDYVTLPGMVTIPAGRGMALVSVVPLDDGSPDITSTVVIKLTPATNTPPDYLVGVPAAAAALILDGQWPTPVAGMLPDRCFHVTATGPNGTWFSIDYTTDLVHWISLCTNQVVNGSIDFVDPDAPGSATRFYRAVPVLQAPAF
jgi:hypothetical protein